MDKKITIGCAIIAKNEMEHIGRLLESVKEADQIVVCDTGSTDNGATMAIARQYTPEVYDDYKWNDSFCEARNHVKSKMKTDWIFSIDCDEFCHDWSKVREAVEYAEANGIQAIDVTQIAEDSGQTNSFPRVFKNSPAITWHGVAHNHLNVVGTLIGRNDDGAIFTATAPYTADQPDKSLIKLTFGFSLAHLSDPDRTMRILEKALKEGKAGPREMYYLAREYFYRNRFPETTALLGRYVQVSRFLAEKADAFLMMARSYWAQRMGDDARDACAQAIIINPDFKEALLFMADLSWPRQANRWRSFAELSDNSDVLFKRT